MELDRLGGGGVKPERGVPRLYRVALAMCVCVCAALLLALILECRTCSRSMRVCRDSQGLCVNCVTADTSSLLQSVPFHFCSCPYAG